MEFTFKRKSGKSSTDTSPNALGSMFQRWYGFLIVVLLTAGIAYGLYNIYLVTFDTLIVQKTVNPNELQQRQEKIDISKYESTSKLLLLKQKTNPLPSTVKDLFGSAAPAPTNTSTKTSVPLP